MAEEAEESNLVIFPFINRKIEIMHLYAPIEPHNLILVTCGVSKQVKIEVLEKDDTNLRIVVRDADVPLMNALRRIALAEVPCMAIDEVVMIENSSILQDEMIAHRLGLISIKNRLRRIQPS